MPVYNPAVFEFEGHANNRNCRYTGHKIRLDRCLQDFTYLERIGSGNMFLSSRLNERIENRAEACNRHSVLMALDKGRISEAVFIRQYVIV